MSKYELRDVINDYMPSIDRFLQDLNIPIFERYINAAKTFVDVAIIDSSFDSKDDILKSDSFHEGIIPLVKDWYLEQYGELSIKPKIRRLSGIVTPYGHPVLIKIPSTTSRVEIPNESAWLTFPDSLQDNESLSDMIQTQVKIDKLPKEEKCKLFSDFKDVVAKTRSINLSIRSATDLDEETANMAQGIWSHFEKSISDILSYQIQQASIGCWELHLAIEKTFKVFLKQVSGSRPFGHDLITIGQKVQNYLPSIDLPIIQSLPSDKDAIKHRYSELITDVGDVVSYYKSSLKLVYEVTDKLYKKYQINNASFLVKMAP